MQKLEILGQLPNVPRRHEVSKCCWKTGADRLAAGLQLVKNAGLQSAVKQSALKRGLPVYCTCDKTDLVICMKLLFVLCKNICA